jgi:multidrug efflux system outer membrane protein
MITCRLSFNATVLAVAMLAGCSLTPEFVRPDAPIPGSYPGVVQDGSAAPAATPDWRSFFPDEQLQRLIATALENNRDLRTAALRIEEARALYNIQAADLLPNLNVTAGGSRSRSPLGPAAATAATGGAAGAAAAGGQPITTYQTGLSLAAFELDFFGRVRSLNEAALALYLATEEARMAAQVSLISEVARAFLTTNAFSEQLTVARQTFDSRQNAYELSKKRYDVGASSALDLRLNETLVQSARVSVLTLQRQLAQSRNALALLTGAPTAFVEIPQRGLDAQPIVVDIPAGVPSELLIRRPDIRAAEQRLRSANAQIGAARAAFFPRISLTAGVGTASRELSDLFDAGSRTWSFVPQLVLPIFDAGRNQTNLTLAQVRKNIAINDYEETIQIAFREVADALVARDLLEEQVDAQQRVLEAQAERLKLANLRFESGIASSLEVLDAQRDLFTAQQQLVQARLLRLTNGIDLYRSLGGGIDQTAADLPAR